MTTHHVTDTPQQLNQQPEQQAAPEGITTEIANVTMHPSIHETSSFQEVLQAIPKQVELADRLLEDYRKDREAFLANVEEDEIDAQLKDMQHVLGFTKEIEKSKKEIKKYLNAQRDVVMDTLETRLNDARFHDLMRAEADIKQLKKDAVADRRAKRWEEIRATFEANVNRYPLLGEYAPELTDFSKFKLLFPKLVSGGKTVRVKEADHTKVNETLYAWNTAVELMKDNEWGLSIPHLNQLLTMFKHDPSVELVQREGRRLKLNAEQEEKARIEMEQRRREQEEQARIAAEQRQAELARIQEQEALARQARDRQAQEQAIRDRQELEERTRLVAEQERQQRAAYDQFNGQYATVLKESYPQFMAYLFNKPDYHDVHTNPTTKARIVHDIMHQVDHDGTVVTMETGRDPQRVLDLVRYILDA